jgi:hypothetical protein
MRPDPYDFRCLSSSSAALSPWPLLYIYTKRREDEYRILLPNSIELLLAVDYAMGSWEGRSTHYILKEDLCKCLAGPFYRYLGHCAPILLNYILLYYKIEKNFL